MLGAVDEKQPGEMPDQGAGGWSLARFFAWLRGLGVTRSDDRWLAGVCGAVAQRTGLDPLVVRGVAIVVALLGGPALLAYAVGWALFPDSAGRIHLERVMRGIVDPAIIAIGVLVVLTFVPAAQGIWWRGVPVAWGMPDWLAGTLGTAWTIVLVGAAVWLVVVFARNRNQPPRASGAGSGPDAGPRPDPWTATAAASVANPARPSWQEVPPNQQDRRAWHEQRIRAQRAREAERHARRRDREPSAAFVAISLGVAVVAGGVVAVWAQAAGLSVPVLGIGTALAVLAVATIVSGIRGRESGGLGLLSIIAVIGLVVTGVLPAGTQVSVIGGTTWRIDHVPHGTERDYAMVVGGPTLDLRQLDAADGGGSVGLWLGAGGATVLLPTDAPVRVQVSGVGYGVATGHGDDDGTGGVLGTTVLENRAARAPGARDTTEVHVWMLGGGADLPNAVTVEGGTGR
jgi:phage shock protein PspC (stress-responsive transcriptional regulator)